MTDVARTKRRRAVLLVLLVLTCLLIALGPSLRKRFDLLKAYVQLTSQSDANTRLEYIPPTVVLNEAPTGQVMSIGCAEFVWPFGRIESVEWRFGEVVIAGQNILVRAGLPYDPRKRAEATLKDEQYTSRSWIEISGTKPRTVHFEQVAERETFLLRQEAENPYAFKKDVMSMKPKPLAELTFMGRRKLEVHQHLLQMKYLGYDPAMYFFETPTIRGYAETIAGDPRHLYIDLWDPNKKNEGHALIHRLSEVADDRIQQFLASFRYTVDSVQSEDALEEMVQEVISKHPKYREHVPETTPTPVGPDTENEQEREDPEDDKHD